MPGVTQRSSGPGLSHRGAVAQAWVSRCHSSPPSMMAELCCWLGVGPGERTWVERCVLGLCSSFLFKGKHLLQCCLLSDTELGHGGIGLFDGCVLRPGTAERWHRNEGVSNHCWTLSVLWTEGQSCPNAVNLWNVI